MSICNSQNFSGGFTSGSPLKGKGRNWEGRSKRDICRKNGHKGGEVGKREIGKGKEKQNRQVWEGLEGEEENENGGRDFANNNISLLSPWLRLWMRQ
jgi:hypothetical protein